MNRKTPVGNFTVHFTDFLCFAKAYPTKPCH